MGHYYTDLGFYLDSKEEAKTIKEFRKSLDIASRKHLKYTFKNKKYNFEGKRYLSLFNTAEKLTIVPIRFSTEAEGMLYCSLDDNEHFCSRLTDIPIATYIAMILGPSYKTAEPPEWLLGLKTPLDGKLIYSEFQKLNIRTLETADEIEETSGLSDSIKSKVSVKVDVDQYNNTTAVYDTARDTSLRVLSSARLRNEFIMFREIKRKDHKSATQPINEKYTVWGRPKDCSEFLILNCKQPFNFRTLDCLGPRLRLNICLQDLNELDAIHLFYHYTTEVNDEFSILTEGHTQQAADVRLSVYLDDFKVNINKLTSAQLTLLSHNFIEPLPNNLAKWLIYRAMNEAPSDSSNFYRRLYGIAKSNYGNHRLMNEFVQLENSRFISELNNFLNV